MSVHLVDPKRSDMTRGSTRLAARYGEDGAGVVFAEDASEEDAREGAQTVGGDELAERVRVVDLGRRLR